MTTEAHNVKYRRQLAKLEACRRNPDKFKMLPRERIRIKRRCQRSHRKAVKASPSAATIRR